MGLITEGVDQWCEYSMRGGGGGGYYFNNWNEGNGCNLRIDL